MKNLFLLVLLLFSLTIFSQKTTDSIASRSLDQERVYTVSLPASYIKNKDKKYPLLFLLDGDYLLDPFNGALSYGNYWDNLPEVIIVGIHQNKNQRDDDTMFDGEAGLPIEKGAAFFDFLNTELFPTLEKKYRIAPFRIVAGHDATAGFLNYFLYAEKPYFNAYISLSPEFTPKMEEKIINGLATSKTPIFYYQSTSDSDLKKTRKQLQTLDVEIKKLTNGNLVYKFDDFKNATHYSLVLYSIPNALYTVFSEFQPISTTEYQEKIAVLPSDYSGYLAAKYETIEKVYGVKMPVRLNDFNAIETAILKNNAYNELDQLSILADKSYPKKMLADYYLGLMFEKKDDNKRAIRYYLSAFQKEEIGDLTKDIVMQKVEELKKKQGKKNVEIEEIETETPAEEKKP